MLSEYFQKKIATVRASTYGAELPVIRHLAKSTFNEFKIHVHLKIFLASFINFQLNHASLTQFRQMFSHELMMILFRLLSIYVIGPLMGVFCQIPRSLLVLHLC